MSATEHYLNQLNRCGIFDCFQYFLIAFIASSIILIIINIWIYYKVTNYVNQIYPEKPCSV